MTDKQALREAAEKALPAMKRLLMMPNDELFDEALLNVDGDVDVANAFNLLAGPEAMLALLDELEALQSFRTAFNEWHDKTEWVQGDKRFDVIKPWGKHRADVLKLYIDHLESKLESAKQDSAKWFKAFEKAVSIGARYEERIAEQQRSLDHREFLLLSADQVQREYAEALGCDGDNESILEAIDDMKKRIAELEAKLQTADKLQDSAFRHGLQHGFSYGQTNDQAGFEQCLAAYSSRGKDNG
ncbi:ead/Ea22-like family protein [Citrobacter koseri]|uniref:ead/Ea22-like family protein n=1 Tax=Citrobacter koseri TaxID=545 RepID=UPI003CEEE263